jgi:F-type H+-transporting ATPase subunit b
MKRPFVLSLVFGLALLAPCFAQEGGSHSEQEDSSQEIWKVANFIILVGALGFLIGKSAGPFFAARLRGIREDMLQGEEARKDAERRSAEVDLRLAHLDLEIADLRRNAQIESDQERERMTRQLAAEIGKVRTRAEEEIAAAGKTARTELKRYVAELAIGLAEQKIRARVNVDVQDELIGAFTDGLDNPAPQARVN